MCASNNGGKNKCGKSDGIQGEIEKPTSIDKDCNMSLPVFDRSSRQSISRKLQKSDKRNERA